MVKKIKVEAIVRKCNLSINEAVFIYKLHFLRTALTLIFLTMGYIYLDLFKQYFKY